MTEINMLEAKTNMTKMKKSESKQEKIVISRNGKPCEKLVDFEKKQY